MTATADLGAGLGEDLGADLVQSAAPLGRSDPQMASREVQPGPWSHDRCATPEARALFGQMSELAGASGVTASWVRHYFGFDKLDVARRLLSDGPADETRDRRAARSWSKLVSPAGTRASRPLAGGRGGVAPRGIDRARYEADLRAERSRELRAGAEAVEREARAVQATLRGLGDASIGATAGIDDGASPDRSSVVEVAQPFGHLPKTLAATHTRAPLVWGIVDPVDVDLWATTPADDAALLDAADFSSGDMSPVLRRRVRRLLAFARRERGNGRRRRLQSSARDRLFAALERGASEWLQPQDPAYVEAEVDGLQRLFGRAGLNAAETVKRLQRMAVFGGPAYPFRVAEQAIATPWMLWWAWARLAQLAFGAGANGRDTPPTEAGRSILRALYILHRHIRPSTAREYEQAGRVFAWAVSASPVAPGPDAPETTVDPTLREVLAGEARVSDVAHVMGGLLPIWPILPRSTDRDAEDPSFAFALDALSEHEVMHAQLGATEPEFLEEATDAYLDGTAERRDALGTSSSLLHVAGRDLQGDAAWAAFAAALPAGSELRSVAYATPVPAQAFLDPD